MALLHNTLDQNLPETMPHSLRRFYVNWRKLDGDLDAQCLFGLTGHYNVEQEGGEPRHFRAQIEVQSSVLPDSAELTQVSDIDSAIGILNHHFPLQNNSVFSYHVLNDGRYCLSSNLHIPGYKVPDGAEAGTLKSYKDIPHAVFGSLDNLRTIIRVFFPKATSDNPFLSRDWLEPFYDLAVLPAARELEGADHYINSWPVSYMAEVNRAKKEAGGYIFSGQQCTGAHMKAMVIRIRELVDSTPELWFARGCFWMVEIKGVKAFSAHPPPRGPLVDEQGEFVEPPHMQPRNAALQVVLSNWEWATFGTHADVWYLDIATTFSVSIPEKEDHNCLQIRKSAHPEIIRHFTQQPIEKCYAWASKDDGVNYQFDMNAHLLEVGGFRLTVRDPDEETVRYLQAYTSDKSHTFHRSNNGVAMKSSPHKVLDNWKKEKDRFYEPIVDMFDKSGNHDTSLAVTVRFESRVPFAMYTHVHLAIPTATCFEWFFCFRARPFWHFKVARLDSIMAVLDSIDRNRIKAQPRHLHPISSLVVVLVWMANALVNRPDSGGSYDEIRDSGTVHRQRASSGEVVPVHPLGCYMVHSLVKDPVYRLSGYRIISEPTLLQAIFPRQDGANIADLAVLVQKLYQRPELLQKRAAPPMFEGEEEQPVSSAIVRKAPPIRNNKRPRIDARLLEDATDIFGEGPGLENIPGFSEEVENLDDSDKDGEGNARSGGVTYREISEVVGMLVSVTNNIFMSKAELDDIWSSYWLIEDYDRWMNAVGRLFPTFQEFSATKINGLDKMSYRKQWINILTRLPNNLKGPVVTAVRKYVNERWHWMPAMEGGKLWSTYKNHKGREIYGPWLVSNPQFS